MFFGTDMHQSIVNQIQLKFLLYILLRLTRMNFSSMMSVPVSKNTRWRPANWRAICILVLRLSPIISKVFLKTLDCKNSGFIDSRFIFRQARQICGLWITRLDKFLKFQNSPASQFFTVTEILPNLLNASNIITSVFQFYPKRVKATITHKIFKTKSCFHVK